MFNGLYLMMSVREYKSCKTRLVTHVSYAVTCNRRILSSDLVITDEFWIDDRIYKLLQLVVTSKDCVLTVLHTSQITTGCTRSSQSVSAFTSPLPVSGFQWQTFPFLWVPERSLASATSFSQQQLTTTEPQRLIN
jgi:hypothetical protein